MSDVKTGGYIKLFRKFFTSDFWQEEREFSRAEAWLDLLNIVEFVRSSKFIRGKRIIVEVGETIASGRYLAERWHWSHKRVRNFLSELERAHQITQRMAQGENIIKLLKYGIYNPLEPEKGTPKGTPKGTDRAHPGHKIEELKELKEINNIKEKFLLDSAERIWQAYPKKDGKNEGIKAILKRLKEGLTEEYLIGRVKAYCLTVQGKEKQYIKQAQGWFNGERYLDSSLDNPELPKESGDIDLDTFRIAYRKFYEADFDVDFCAKIPHHRAVLKADLATLKSKFADDYEDIKQRLNAPFSKLRIYLNKQIRK